ncbi:MAG: oligopeptide/dipeptide transporter, ATPase subunit, partial [Marmoricola sp.]|nr:oligopeptide/dipeptide transporter, ATPase subunit [Marmoricola sp.]
QILDLIRDLQQEFNSAVVIITHDLGVVAELADDILVMYAGRAIEHGTAEQLFNAPEHPYTWGLLGSMPRFDRAPTDRLLPIKGTPPSLIRVPKGCAFNPRCDYQERVGSACLVDRPDLVEGVDHHLVACHIPPTERQQIWAQEISPRLA